MLFRYIQSIFDSGISIILCGIKMNPKPTESKTAKKNGRRTCLEKTQTRHDSDLRIQLPICGDIHIHKLIGMFAKQKNSPIPKPASDRNFCLCHRNHRRTNQAIVQMSVRHQKLFCVHVL